MASYLLFLLALTSLLPTTRSLQVASNSRCASVCMNHLETDPDSSNPNASNTLGTEVVCRDSDYSVTMTGLKYRDCVSCLQTSGAKSGGDSDQAWFLFKDSLRYTVNKCLFKALNTSNQIDSACSLESACSPLKPALEAGMQAPSLANEFTYCTANESGITFTSSYLASCKKCLQKNTDMYYLSNFLVALETGCNQRPGSDTLIGLNGTLFSHLPVEIIDPASNINMTKQTSRSKLTRAAIVGIAIGAAILVFISGAFAFVCVQKQRNTTRLLGLRSGLNPRFGATRISAPIQGAYISPENSPPLRETHNTLAPFPRVEKKAVEMHHLSSIRNFSKRNYGLYQNTRLDHTTRGVKTAESYSPGPLSFSPNEGREFIPFSFPVSRNHGTVNPLASNPPEPCYTSEPFRGRGARYGRYIPSMFSYISMLPSHTRQPSASVPANVPEVKVPKREPSPELHISAPMMCVGTQFANDEDSRRTKDRQQKEGVSATTIRRNVFGGGVKSPTERVSPMSASTAVSEEMWPGSF